MVGEAMALAQAGAADEALAALPQPGAAQPEAVPVLRALTANRLIDGEVVFWSGEAWVERFGEGASVRGRGGGRGGRGPRPRPRSHPWSIPT